MTKPEAVVEYKYLRKLFDKWQPTDEQVVLYIEEFQKFPDGRLLRRAIERHFHESRFQRPTSGRIAQLVQIITNQGAPREAKESGHGMTGVHIQCIEAPVQWPGRLGTFVELCYARDERIPEDHIVMRDAETMRDRYEKAHGGNWRIVQGASASEMMADGSNMRTRAKEKSE